MSKLYHVSSSPHARSRLTTGKVMRQVICALLPITYACCRPPVSEFTGTGSLRFWFWQFPCSRRF